MASPRRGPGLTCSRDGLGLNEIDDGTLRGLFTLHSPTETFKTKLPTENVSHGDQHAEMLRSSGVLSDIARAKETGLCCTRCSHPEAREKRHKTTHVYSFCGHNKTTRMKKNNVRHQLWHVSHYNVISGQLFLFFPIDTPFFFLFRIRHNEMCSIWGNVWKRKMQF